MEIIHWICYYFEENLFTGTILKAKGTDRKTEFKVNDWWSKFQKQLKQALPDIGCWHGLYVYVENMDNKDVSISELLPKQKKVLRETLNKIVNDW